MVEPQRGGLTMKKNFHAVSDTLFGMAKLFGEYASGQRIAGERDVRILQKLARRLGSEALEMEHEISRHRWNEEARRERETEIVLDQIRDPDSNIRLFPVVPRPFGDSRGAV
jgi:hypothetical protein